MTLISSGECNILYQTPTGLWITFRDQAYKLTNYAVSNLSFSINRNTVGYHFLDGSSVKYLDGKIDYDIDVRILATEMTVKPFKKITDLFSMDDIKLLSKLINKKFLDINEEKR